MVEVLQSDISLVAFCVYIFTSSVMLLCFLPLQKYRGWFKLYFLIQQMQPHMSSNFLSTAGEGKRQMFHTMLNMAFTIQ